MRRFLPVLMLALMSSACSEEEATYSYDCLAGEFVGRFATPESQHCPGIEYDATLTLNEDGTGVLSGSHQGRAEDGTDPCATVSHTLSFEMDYRQSGPRVEASTPSGSIHEFSGELEIAPNCEHLSGRVHMTPEPCDGSGYCVPEMPEFTIDLRRI